ncbi:MAG: hypothetical protein KDA78_03200 [Planctomycetaceae bacterium]|nr:hypothetical protein [Planctomycetaceae bacterium]
MNDALNHTNQEHKAFRTAFRWSLIAFLLAWSSVSYGEDSKSLGGPDSGSNEGLPILIQPDEIKSSDLPPALNETPQPAAETDGKLKPVQPKKGNQPMPLIKPEAKPKKKTKPVQAPELKESLPAVEAPAPFQAEEWTMVITSGPTSVAGTPAQKEVVSFQLDPITKTPVAGPHVETLGANDPLPPGAVSVGGMDPHRYREVYNSIPYSRAEYLANPAYRHEATMEMLAGELRPTVIHKQDKPVRVYNQPVVSEPQPRFSHPIPWNWYSPAYGYGPAYYFNARYPYWTPNSTYRRYPTPYGSLYNRYYRPLGYGY